MLKILEIMIVILLVFALLVLLLMFYCACAISSECSREEERIDLEEIINGTKEK